MRWFDRWFVRKCIWAWDHGRELLATIEGEKDSNKLSSGKLMAVPTPRDGPTINWSEGLNINVKKVIGGFVVSFQNYDRKTDRNDSRHYLITDEQDFERELGKMITLESMRQ